jgi:hypothetical protein
LWEILVFYPVAHWIWGGGWLAKLGALDFAGGIVIHTSAGIGALVLALSKLSFSFPSTLYSTLYSSILFLFLFLIPFASQSLDVVVDSKRFMVSSLPPTCLWQQQEVFFYGWVGSVSTQVLPYLLVLSLSQLLCLLKSLEQSQVVFG